jgi:hypothetical protein
VATSETGIKHKPLSVPEEPDVINKADITSNACHKKITEELDISIST